MTELIKFDNKATFVAYPEDIDAEDQLRAQESFARFFYPHTNNYASLIGIRPDNAVLGIPFTWGLSPNGGVFTFYLFNGVGRETLRRAKIKLRRSQDVAGVITERIQLVAGWEPPTPFSRVPPPSWINDPSYNFIDGMILS